MKMVVMPLLGPLINRTGFRVVDGPQPSPLHQQFQVPIHRGLVEGSHLFSTGFENLLDPQRPVLFHENLLNGARDPHIWLSPPLVVIQARNILKGLQEVDPEHAAFYAANCRTFISMVESLDQELRRVFADLKGRAFMVFHPSWGYFAHAYGLKQVPVEIEGKHPKPAQLKALIDYARAHRVQVVFAQPKFSSKSAEQVAREIGGRVAFADPMPLNWADHLREMAAAFREAAR